MVDFDNCEKYLRNISKKYYYGSVKKIRSLIQFQFAYWLKKIINIKKEDSMRKKLIQTLIFPKLPSADEILIRRDVVNCIS